MKGPPPMSPTKAVTTTAEERKRAGLAARELQAQADRALLALQKLRHGRIEP